MCDGAMEINAFDIIYSRFNSALFLCIITHNIQGQIQPSCDRAPWVSGTAGSHTLQAPGAVQEDAKHTAL